MLDLTYVQLEVLDQASWMGLSFWFAGLLALSIRVELLLFVLMVTVVPVLVTVVPVLSLSVVSVLSCAFCSVENDEMSPKYTTYFKKIK